MGEGANRIVRGDSKASGEGTTIQNFIYGEFVKILANGRDPFQSRRKVSVILLARGFVLMYFWIRMTFGSYSWK